MSTRPQSRLALTIQWGLVTVVALMPFHAFLSVWLGSITHHQAIIQAWKELLLVVLTALTAAYLVREPEARRRLRAWPVICAGILAAIAVLITLATRPSATAIAFGAKTDLEFLLAFVLATIVATPKFTRTLIWTILASSSLVVAFGLLEVYALPAAFLTHFGYGPNTIQPYLVLDPAVHSLRFPATLGGPNQLGTFLILPMALATIVAVRRRIWWWLLLTAASIPVLIHTYSRAAWLGALAAAVVVLLALAPARLRAPLTTLIGLIGLLATIATSRILALGGSLQYYILHGSKAWHSKRGSDYEHLQSLRTGVDLTLQQPLGHGLGTAGPTVFHTGNGVVIENFYLQLSYETGIAGLIAFAAFVASTAWMLARRASSDLAAASLAAIVGICVTAAVLPAWTDSSTALTVAIAAGAAIGLSRKEAHV